MDTILSLISLISPPIPHYTGRATNAPPPQPTRPVPYDYTGLVVIGAVVLIGLALMRKTK